MTRVLCPSFVDRSEDGSIASNTDLERNDAIFSKIRPQ